MELAQRDKRDSLSAATNCPTVAAGLKGGPSHEEQAD